MKKKIKSRRKFNLAETFPKKEMKEVMLKDFMIRQAIPDPVERQKYIEGLIEALDNAPIVEN